jgi:DNA polymerase-3 subunit chi
MAALWFYHLERGDVEATMGPLLEKCLVRGWRAIVRGSALERMEALDAALWTYRDDSFLPHGLEGRDELARQPVALTTGLVNPNQAQALFLIDGATLTAFEGYERACVVFDGRDEAALAHARGQWKQAKASGAELAYWKQSADGAWEKQA